MIRTIGCIGLGQMGSALMAAFAERLDKNDWRLCGFDRNPGKVAALLPRGMQGGASPAAVAAEADYIILAVKPGQIPGVLADLAPALGPEKSLISLAAGLGLSALADMAGPGAALARCMPTTTALAGKGLFAFCFQAPEETQNGILRLFASLGLCLTLPESKFSAFSALIGAGPAYVFETMAALEQAGVTLGFKRGQTREMLVNLFAGCAALAEKSGKSFMNLRDDVCSPAGLTIAGINLLDRAGFTGLLVDAVLAADRRGREMERE